MAVAGGEFETLVIELTPLDDDEAGTATLHVMKDAPHYLVRSSVRLGAAMGGGTATGELVSLQAPVSSAR